MHLEIDRVTAFYDALDRKLLADYARGNPRIVAAIKHAISHIPADARRILDIGCGIGWSSREMAAHFPKALVSAVDLSPRLIALAERLNGPGPAVRFQVQDVLSDGWAPADRFQAIVLLDVYEHIPAADRRRFHARLARLLDEEGVIILTCPTPRHQEHLRRCEPAGLQPIDEDVDETVAQALASDVGGRLAHFERQSIWQPDDYTHMVITRDRHHARQRLSLADLESQTRRRDRLARHLNIRVTNSGLVLRTGAAPLIGWAAEPSFAKPDTYAGELLGRLPVSLRLIHGRPLLCDDQRETLILRPPLVKRLAQRAVRRLGRAASAGGEVEAAIARYLRRQNVALLVADNAVLGLEMMTSARTAGIPLIVCVRGRDAFARPVLEGAGRRYAELFDQATSIVVPSEHMRRRLAALGAPPHKLVVICPGPDPQRFQGADPARAAPQFLCAAPLVEKSGTHLLLVAMAQVLARCPEARLKIVGDGPLAAILPQLAASLGIGRAVEQVPWQGQRAFAAALGQCRALVHPAITAADGDCDAVPHAILEAQAAGVPVIATRHGAIQELVAHGESALLAEEQDVQAMADHMLRLARDPDEAASLGRRGREQLLSAGRTFEQVLRKWTALLRSVALQDGRSSG